MRCTNALLIALAVAVAACSNSQLSTDDTEAEGTSAPTTTTTAPSAPSQPEATEPSAAEVLLADLGREIQSWGISETSWECVEAGLIEGGHTEGVADLPDIDADTPFNEAPRQLESLIRGLITLMRDPVQGCLSAAEIATAEDFFAANSEAPGSYGSDPSRDMLYDGCQAGSMPDCDMLYLVSEVTSEYADQAATCGGRNEPIEEHTTCMIEYSDVAGFDVLATQCESGFFVACDALYVVAPLGSPEEELAATCGGPRETAYVIPCWISYGMGTR